MDSWYAFHVRLAASRRSTRFDAFHASRVHADAFGSESAVQPNVLAAGTKAVRIAASTKRVETKVSATPPPLSPCMLSGPTDGPLSLDRSFFLRLEYLRSHLFSRLKSAILAHHGADSVSRGETRSNRCGAGLRPQEMVKRPPADAVGGRGE